MECELVKIGVVPDGAEANSAGGGYCDTHFGPMLNSVRILNVGSGIPIPCRWLCVDADLLGDPAVGLCD